jgi:hypothetical protein
MARLPAPEYRRATRTPPCSRAPPLIQFFGSMPHLCKVAVYFIVLPISSLVSIYTGQYDPFLAIPLFGSTNPFTLHSRQRVFSQLEFHWTRTFSPLTDFHCFLRLLGTIVPSVSQAHRFSITFHTKTPSSIPIPYLRLPNTFSPFVLTLFAAIGTNRLNADSSSITELVLGLSCCLTYSNCHCHPCCDFAPKALLTDPFP